ncbi:MAG: glycosyltransferase [Gammaproteobacteria bacterium]|nr:glycosyltransferase [Gammaproteobacteria bacterium]
MHIAHVIPTYLPAKRYGGPIESVHGLSRALVERGHRVQVFTTNVDGLEESPVSTEEPHYLDGVEVRYAPISPVALLRRFYYAPQLRLALSRSINAIDIVHLHSVFLWPISAAARVSAKHRVPYLIAPRGMLDKTLLAARGNLRKRAWITLYEKRTLSRAARIHATSELEVAKLAELGLDLAPVCIVANGTDLPVLTGQVRDADHVLFLGRITPKKGLDQLIPAMARLRHARLTVAGPDERGYRARMEALAADAGVAGRVKFVGRVDRRERDRLLARASVLALPSRSENFANAVLEAMAAGCPVLLSPHVGLARAVDKAGAGLIVEVGVEPIAKGLASILANAVPDLGTGGLGMGGPCMGQAGRRLVERQFTWNAVAGQMETTYTSIIEKRFLTARAQPCSTR